jgi:hypothetical protein
MKKATLHIVSTIGKCVAVILILLAVFGFQPKFIHAALGVSFGGFDVFMFPCTCTAGSLFLHVFAPLYINNPTPIAGLLVAPVTPVAFSTYYVRPASWAKGVMIPGAGVCLMGVPPYCFYIPNYGLITPFTGVSPTI